MEKKLIPEGKISKAKWQNSWREEFMSYDDKKDITSNTLSAGVVGK